MKIKSLATLLFVLITLSSFAQFPLKGANDKDFVELFNSKVYIAKTGDAKMDQETEDAFKNYWKISDYEMISSDDLDEMIKDESKYFMIGIIRTVENSNPSMKDRINKYYVLTRGGYKSIKKVNDGKWLFAFPMDIWGNEGNLTDMAYRMGPNVKMMNEALLAIKSKDAKVSAGKSAANFMIDLYAGKSGDLKDKTLLINSSHVKPENFKPAGFVLTGEEFLHRSSATEADIKKSYPQKYEVVDGDVFYDAIASHRAGTAVVIPVAFANLIYYVIDTETYDCLFYGFQMSGLSLKSKAYSSIIQ